MTQSHTADQPAAPFKGGGSVIVDSLFLLVPLSVGVYVWSLFVIHYPSRFVIISMRKREVVALI